MTHLSVAPNAALYHNSRHLDGFIGSASLINNHKYGHSKKSQSDDKKLQKNQTIVSLMNIWSFGNKNATAHQADCQTKPNPT